MTQTIGQRLKAEREEQHLTLEKVFEGTRIRVQYLLALEADDLSVMPSPVQARGYLRNYAEYLGLNVDQMLDELRAAHAQPVSVEVIGPADETPAIPPQNGKPVEMQSVPPETEVSSMVEEPPALVEVPASSPSVTIPIKPKSVRRKKVDAEPKPDADVPQSAAPQSAVPQNAVPQNAAVESPTRRRSRKKVYSEPESTPVVEEQPAMVEDTALEALPPVEPIPQSENIEEPPVLVETVSELISVPEETPQRVNLWQAWLNRLSARRQRRTPAQEDVPVVKDESAVASTESAVSETEDPAGESSSQIFREIGQELQSRRELLSLHLDEVERNTHVKAHYLSALERGALDDLPSTVQTRGMLSNYATFLDLDVDTLLLRFADALQARHRERNPQKPARQPGRPIIANMPPVRSFIAGDMIFGVGMVILLVGFAIWGVSRVMAIQKQRAIQPTAPSISDMLLASPDPSLFTATPTFLPVEAFPGEATATIEIPTQNANARVQLNLVAVERTYMRVIVDGKESFNGRVVPGNAYPFEAENQIEVLVGSGAAIRIFYNGRDTGLMGTFGQVLNNIYTSTEILTPTALPTLTPTITPTPTNTVPPTATLRFTSTPIPSATAVP